MGEVELAAILCLMLGGEAEVPYSYQMATGERSIRVDCETAEHVIEIGLDKRDSFDSVHQAVVAAELSGKAPKIILINTKGVEDGEEWQVELAARSLGIAYETYTRDFLLRWQMTAPFRERTRDLSAQDVPDVGRYAALAP